MTYTKFLVESAIDQKLSQAQNLAFVISQEQHRTDSKRSILSLINELTQVTEDIHDLVMRYEDSKNEEKYK